MSNAQYIPGTDQIIFNNPHTGDRVVNLQNHPEIDDTLRYEDVIVIGNWEDYSGNGTIGPQQAMMQGIKDIDESSVIAQIWGTSIARTDRGKKAAIRRQRAKLIYIENKNGKKC